MLNFTTQSAENDWKQEALSKKEDVLPQSLVSMTTNFHDGCHGN